MQYGVLFERLAVAHQQIEELLAQLAGQELPPIPPLGTNEPWHRELARVERVRDVLQGIAARQAQAEAETDGRDTGENVRGRRARAHR